MLDKLLKQKGTMDFNTLCGKLGKSSYRTKELLLIYLYKEVSSLQLEVDTKQYKYLYKIFKYFEDVSNEDEKELIISNLEKTVRLCYKRINNFKKSPDTKEINFDILYKLIDIINVTLINIEYTEFGKGKELTADEISYELLIYLIYEVRNYNYLYELLKLFPENLTIRNKDGIYLIDELIMHYIDVVKKNKSNSDIIYYEKIIKLFLNDPKFRIKAGLEETLIKKLEKEIEKIADSPEDIDKNRSKFFLEEAISDIKKSEDEGKDIYKINFKYDINPDFTEDILNEANKTVIIDDKEVLDCRDKYTVTIDNENTVVYDDACSIEQLSNGNHLLGIYVTDVTLAVPKNSLIDIEAKKRAESIYNGGRLITTMLPLNITHGLTLKSNCDRNVFGYFFEIDKDGKCVDFKVRRCLINVCNNYSYDRVNSLLTDSRNIEEINIMKNMYDISNKFHENSSVRTQYRTLKKLKKAIQAEENTADVQTNIAALMIEEFMGKTNAFIANYFDSHPEIPFIYRINLSSYDKNIIDKVKEISRSNISFDEVLNYINYICPPSIYSTVNLGHKGLNLNAYCHATNPLRNYSSLEIERLIIDHMINKNPNIDLGKLKIELDKICAQINQRISLNNDYVEEVKQYVKRNDQLVDK